MVPGSAAELDCSATIQPQPKNKKRKSCYEKSKHSVHTGKTSYPVVPCLLCGSVTSATTPVSARDQVPFNGIVSGTIISTVPVDECHVLIEAVNGGNATQLGRFNGTAEFVLNVCDLTYVGSYVFTGANGDSISGPFTGTLTPIPTPGVFDNSELAFITGGTGRFANATGTFNLGGQINNNAGTFPCLGRGQSPPSAREGGNL
jgi:hypothetical protein